VKSFNNTQYTSAHPQTNIILQYVATMELSTTTVNPAAVTTASSTAATATPSIFA